MVQNVSDNEIWYYLESEFLGIVIGITYLATFKFYGLESPELVEQIQTIEASF